MPSSCEFCDAKASIFSLISPKFKFFCFSKDFMNFWNLSDLKIFPKYFVLSIISLGIPFPFI